MCCYWKIFVTRPLQIGGSVMMWCDASLARIDQLESRGGDESDAWSIPQSPPAKSSKSNTLSSKPPDPGIWWKLCIVLVISLSWANIYKWVSLSVVENWFAVSLTMTMCVCSFTTDPEIVGIGYNDLWFITYRLFASSQCLVTIPARVLHNTIRVVSSRLLPCLATAFCHSCHPHVWWPTNDQTPPTWIRYDFR